MSNPTMPAPDDHWAATPAREKWRGVRVEEAQLTLAAGSEHTMRVWVCIGLGELLPADVLVELVPGAPGTIVGLPPRRPHRLWSAQSYCDGRFVFEGIVPAAELQGPEGYSIRVTRHADAEARRTAPAVVRWFGGVQEATRIMAGRG